MACITLHLPENRSLKGKRSVLKSLIEKIRHRYNAAIAEVDDHDLWQQAKLGLALVSNDSQLLDAMITKIIRYIEDQHVAQVVDSQVELWHW
ncbi:DUF503 domain-containing protein [Desulfobacca acetoxidans]|nr:DUF503 domain-containing protein [Desulfobacca acetoxidans]